MAKPTKYKTYKLTDPLPDAVLRDMAFINAGIAAQKQIAHIRHLNAERQRRFRANKAKNDKK